MADGIPASGALTFQATRNGVRLGTHLLRFNRQDAALRVEITISYAVSLGFITAFRYELRAQEIWADGQLMSFQCTTNNNGRQEYAKGRREGELLMVEGTKAKPYEAPVGTILCTHWNKAQLSGPSVNPQDGSLLMFASSSLGRAVVADSAGVKHACERFRMDGKNAIDLWYDDQGVWLALQAKAEDGSNIVYTRQG